MDIIVTDVKRKIHELVYNGELDTLNRILNQFQFIILQDNNGKDQIINRNEIFNIKRRNISAKEWCLQTYKEFLGSKPPYLLLNDWHIKEVLGDEEGNIFINKYISIVNKSWRQIPKLKEFPNLIKDQNFIGLMSSYFDIEL